MKKRILNLYRDRKSIMFTIALLGLCYWLDSLLPEGNYNGKQGSAIALAVVSGVTALASLFGGMAAKSKAQIGASIEKQEATNQQLRMQGEAKMLDQKMALEQAALGAEADAWGRQETRDVSQLNRMSNLQANAQQQAMAFQMAGDQAMMQGMAGFAEGAAGAATAFASGSKPKTTDTGVVPKSTGGGGGVDTNPFNLQGSGSILSGGTPGGVGSSIYGELDLNPQI